MRFHSKMKKAQSRFRSEPLPVFCEQEGKLSSQKEHESLLKHCTYPALKVKEYLNPTDGQQKKREWGQFDLDGLSQRSPVCR
jgi:hypothetical protein